MVVDHRNLTNGRPFKGESYREGGVDSVDGEEEGEGVCL